jgi:hypothetical protein
MSEERKELEQNLEKLYKSERKTALLLIKMCIYICDGDDYDVSPPNSCRQPKKIKITQELIRQNFWVK